MISVQEMTTGELVLTIMLLVFLVFQVIYMCITDLSKYEVRMVIGMFSAIDVIYAIAWALILIL